jgi:uncharacterized protein
MGVLRNITGILIQLKQYRGKGNQDANKVIVAAKHGRIEEFRSLLDRRDRLHVMSFAWELALGQAVSNGHVEIVTMLLDAGVRKKDGFVTPMMQAAAAGREIVVEALLQRGEDPNGTLHYGWTALMMGAKYGHLGVVRILCDAGADPRLSLKNGQTALSLARKRGHGGIVAYLTDRMEK